MELRDSRKWLWAWGGTLPDDQEVGSVPLAYSMAAGDLLSPGSNSARVPHAGLASVRALPVAIVSSALLAVPLTGLGGDKEDSGPAHVPQAFS